MKLGYVIIYVQDCGLAIDFYEKAFGLTRKFIHESGTYAEMNTETVTLAFSAYSLLKMNLGLDHTDREKAGIEIALLTDNVDSAYRQAVTAGAQALKKPEIKPWGQTVAYVRDPFGTIVELCSPL